MTSPPVFEIGQRVKIKELKRAGRLVGLFSDGANWQYQVRYFDEAKAQTIYFFADELEAES
ncbi:MAG: hypothetical protein HOO67_06370 [Candidatus Peribacteraceae bacterium]|nr:hypothetical protein [Candidatus Peribacteraceae bacterium]